MGLAPFRTLMEERSGRRDPLLVLALEAGVQAPEAVRLPTVETGREEGEMSVPSGRDAQHCAAAREPAVGQDEAHLVARRFEREGHFRAVLPGIAEESRRIDWIAAAGVARGMTGVGLKDESAGLEVLR